MNTVYEPESKTREKNRNAANEERIETVKTTYLNRTGLALAIAVAAALFTGIAAADVLVGETFDTDGGIDTYTGAGELFSAYNANSPATASASGGEMDFQLTGGTETGSLDAHIALGSPTSMLSMKLDFRGNQYGAATTAWTVLAGSYGKMGEYNPNWHPNQGKRNWSKVRVGGGDPYTVNAEDGNNTSYTRTGNVIGDYYTWSLYLNQSGSEQSFYGPDMTPHTVGNDEWSLFVDSDLVADSVPKGTEGASGSIEGVVLRMTRNYPGGTSDQSIDNILIRDDLNLFVPEPATFSLLLLGALAFSRRNRPLHGRRK